MGSPRSVSCRLCSYIKVRLVRTHKNIEGGGALLRRPSTTESLTPLGIRTRMGRTLMRSLPYFRGRWRAKTLCGLRSGYALPPPTQYQAGRNPLTLTGPENRGRWRVAEQHTSRFPGVDVCGQQREEFQGSPAHRFSRRRWSLQLIFPFAVACERWKRQRCRFLREERQHESPR